MSELTGVAGLRHDPRYAGGGTHENLDGMELDPHVDFEKHPASSLRRRVNLLLYLNSEWKAAWGGALQLHRDPRRGARDAVKTILPLFNRCVVFAVGEGSWHGFPRIRLPKGRSGASRRSIALYLYTPERPGEGAPGHATRWVFRGVPPRLKPGRVLTSADLAELERLLARRDLRLEQLERQERHRRAAAELARGGAVKRQPARPRR